MENMNNEITTFRCAASVAPEQKNDIHRFYGINIDAMIDKQLKDQCTILINDWVAINAINVKPEMVLPLKFDSINYCISKDMIIFTTHESLIKLYESINETYMIHPIDELEKSGKLIKIYTDLKCEIMFAIKNMPKILNEKFSEEQEKRIYDVVIETKQSLFDGIIVFRNESE